MDYTVIRRGSRLKRVIVDRYNVVEPNSRIGFDAAADRMAGTSRGFGTWAKRPARRGERLGAFQMR